MSIHGSVSIRSMAFLDRSVSTLLLSGHSAPRSDCSLPDVVSAHIDLSDGSNRDAVTLIFKPGSPGTLVGLNPKQERSLIKSCLGSDRARK